MSVLNEEQVVEFLKRNPQFVGRYIKENCEKELLLHLPVENDNVASPNEQTTRNSQRSINITRVRIKPPPHAWIPLTMPGVVVVGHKQTSTENGSMASTLSTQSEPPRRRAESCQKGKPRRSKFSIRTGSSGRSVFQDNNKKPVAEGDMKESDSTNPPNITIDSKLNPPQDKQFENNSVVQTLEIVVPSKERYSPQSNHNIGANGRGSVSSYDEIKTKYLPLRPSTFLSSQLLLAAKKGDISREMIFSDMTASVCERVPVDGSNLYLVDNDNHCLYVQPPNQPILSSLNSQECFELGTCKSMVAYAAHMRQPVFSDELPKDVHFQEPTTGLPTKVKHKIAYPILNADGRPIGVIELYRSATRRAFSDSEKQIVSTIVHWAELVHESNGELSASTKARKVSDFILEIIRNLFSKVRSMDQVIKAIMEHAKELVKAERVTLFLVDAKKNELYSSILDVGNLNESKFVEDENVEIRFPITEGIAGYVARNGVGVRIDDAYSDKRFYRRADEAYQHLTKTVLATPLFDEKEVVGVLEMINKSQGVFDEEDEELMALYSVYCGLAINVARMYDRIYRSDKKYRVAMEVLTFHSLVSESEVEQAVVCEIPKNIPGIAAYDFSPWDVAENDEITTVCYMVYNLGGNLPIDKKTLMRFAMTVRKNYRPIYYHNWDHGFSVAHSMFFLLSVGKHSFSNLEKVSLFIACLCHDLDHRGYDNRFMKKYSTPLAALYSSSPMEHHHFNMTVTILQQRGHNVFSNCKTGSYRNILSLIKHAILATDLATFWASKNKLDTILDSDTGVDWSQDNHRLAVISIAMPTCDLCAMYKPWDIQVKVVMLIMQEFWAQGDEEKASHSKPLSLMDRDEAVQLADGQIGFIRGICLPCYNTISRVWPTVHVIVDVTQQNLARWESISTLSYEEREQLLMEQMGQKFPKIEQRSKR
ncbi:Phosphodiesterase [Fasciola hepatica]|uniref:Phosphodiesterase n=1 Tax=Fasciola hepatica TaxID=6192 RepID=A0A4E0RE18_FASHE|nr:Phosphodiesterase [Fasciola hepatica]